MNRIRCYINHCISAKVRQPSSNSVHNYPSHNLMQYVKYKRENEYESLLAIVIFPRCESCSVVFFWSSATRNAQAICKFPYITKSAQRIIY